MALRRPSTEEVLDLARLIGLPKFDLTGTCEDVWYFLLHEVGHWAVLPDWLISMHLNSEFYRVYGNKPIFETTQFVDEEWKRMSKPVPEVPDWAFESEVSWFEHPMWRVPTPFVHIKKPDGTNKIIRVAADEYGVRAWCVKVLDFFGWENPADSVCYEPGLWRIDQEDEDNLKKYFGDEFRLRAPDNFCYLDWGVDEAEDKVFYYHSSWSYDRFSALSKRNAGF